jgi:hypothetical protein
MASRKEQKERAREARIAREAELREAAKRRRVFTLGGGGTLAVVVAAVAVVLAVTGGGSSASERLSKQGSTPELKLSSLKSVGDLQPPPAQGAVGPEGVSVPNAPVLASTSSMASGNPVDGVGCLGQEQTLFHIHAHLTVFVDGSQRQIPYGIGITSAQAQSTPEGTYVGNGNCFYFLHAHAADGIIHIESPVQRTYTLADYFDIWGQPLGPDQVGPARGPVTAFYNGQRYDGNPRDVPLNAHAQIQLDVGRPLIGPVKITFPGSL